MNDFIKMLKENKKLSYAVNIFILLVIISIILKLDFSKVTQEPEGYREKEGEREDYVYSLEKRMEEILGKVEGVNRVDVMIYTKKPLSWNRFLTKTQAMKQISKPPATVANGRLRGRRNKARLSWEGIIR